MDILTSSHDEIFRNREPLAQVNQEVIKKQFEDSLEQSNRKIEMFNNPPDHLKKSKKSLEKVCQNQIYNSRNPNINEILCGGLNIYESQSKEPQATVKMDLSNYSKKQIRNPLQTSKSIDPKKEKEKRVRAQHASSLENPSFIKPQILNQKIIINNQNLHIKSKLWL